MTDKATSDKARRPDGLWPLAWMVTNDDGQDAYVTADPSLAAKGQRALALYATVPAVQLELERTAAALALELAEARHALEKLRNPHPRLRISNTGTERGGSRCKARSWMTMANGKIEVNIKGLKPTQDLHAAVCDAVTLLNCCPEAACFTDVRHAHDRLRRALVDFADASGGELEMPTKASGPFDWAPAPRRTEWGAGMVLADVEIDRDHTLSIYAEADQASNVAAALRRALTA